MIGNRVECDQSGDDCEGTVSIWARRVKELKDEPDGLRVCMTEASPDSNLAYRCEAHKPEAPPYIKLL